MTRALVMASALALLAGCGKPKAQDESKPGAEPAMGTQRSRPGPGAGTPPVFRPPGTAARSTCGDTKHRLWASCQAAILMKYQDKPSFKLQFPGCRPEAVRSGADGVHVVTGTFTTWNTGTVRSFSCKLRKGKAGYDLVSAEVTDAKAAAMRPAAAKAPGPRPQPTKEPAPKK